MPGPVGGQYTIYVASKKNNFSCECDCTIKNCNGT